jgi:hypothetical protein
MSEQRETFEGWAILELMGHRKLGGKLSEQVIGGQAFVRIDAYEGDDAAPSATQFYSGSSIYAITPCGEATARAIAAYHRPQPVTVWEVERGRAIAAESQTREEDPAELWEDEDDGMAPPADGPDRLLSPYEPID